MIRKQLYEILETSSEKSKLGKLFDGVLFSLILINVIAVILETEQNLFTQYRTLFNTVEIVSVVLFTMEYVIRVWTCTGNEKYSIGIKGRLKYIVSPLAMIDLLAIIPFYLPFLIPLDMRFVRSLRLIRMIRIFKVGRYTEAYKLISKVLKNKREELLITIFIVAILLVFAASLMYYAENQVQPKVFPSILSAMWWGIATLTTVGYGDVYPITGLGKVFAGAIALLGIGLFALPAGIISSGLMEVIQSRNKKSICPKCGSEVEN